MVYTNLVDTFPKLIWGLKSIHWVNSSAQSSFFEKHIILTKPFQPARADISCSFFEKHIIVQNFLLSEWALVYYYYFVEKIMKVLKIQLFLYVPTYDCPYKSQTLSYLCKGLLFRPARRMPTLA